MASYNLFCSSLRRRPDWASLPSALTSSTHPRWRGTYVTNESPPCRHPCGGGREARALKIGGGGGPERQLDTHDVALPLPLLPSAPMPASSNTAAAPATAATVAPPPPRALRVVFLVPEDVGSEATRARLERLYHLDGGRDAAVVLLLKKCEEGGGEGPMAAFMRLQLNLVGNFEMPVIPVDSATAVPRVLLAFHQRLSTSRSQPRASNPARTLLKYCSDKPPLSEHTVNVLTDITTGFRDMLDGMSTPSGRSKLEEYLDEDAERTMAFWREEYLVD